MRTENAAQLGVIFEARRPRLTAEPPVWPTDAVLVFQKAARTLHRNAERACNEECSCSRCRGDGYLMENGNARRECPACAGSGFSFGKREARLMDKLRGIAGAYRLRVYEQGDPRGWPLYLIPEEAGPKSEDGSWYSSRGVAVCPH